MYPNLISRNSDLKQLRDEGYEIEIKDGFLVTNNVPYLNAEKQIKYGALVTELTISGEVIGRPLNHVIHFTGEFPCHIDGTPISQLKYPSNLATRKFSNSIIVNFSFSNKPAGGLKNYYEKIIHYVRILSAPAQHYDDVTAQTFNIIDNKEDGSVFNYIDTNSSRAEINQITNKLFNQKIAIIGVGGTGSYILDYIAKTPVKEIHIFDADKFIQHNAFRAPGAPDLETLSQMPLKVNYLSDIYSKMHKNIIVHPYNIDSDNVNELAGLDFVFLSIDKGDIKMIIIDFLEKNRIAFNDVGMGIEVMDGRLIGTLRVSTNDMRNDKSIIERNRISLKDDLNGVYKQNIQIAELNSLNAALAVIKWKKIIGFYSDSEKELHSTYTIDENQLLSDDNEV